MRDSWIGFGKIWPNDRECVNISLCFFDELANQCCMLQAARISLHYSVLNTGIDEPIGGQICCSPFGDDGPEDFPLYVHEGNLLELVESCGI